MGIGANCAIDLAQVALNRSEDIGEPSPPSVDMVRNMNWFGSYMSPASALARKSEHFRKLFDNTMQKVNFRNLLMSDHEDMFAKLSKLPIESQQRLNAVLEYLRFSQTAVSKTGRKLSIKTRLIEREGADGITRRFNLEMSKPGDTLTLTKEETEIFHEIREWLDDRYTLNGKSILAGFGYAGEYSLDGIKALPDNTSEEIQFRDSLLRLFEAYEKQRKTSYIPAMRSGDVKVIVNGPDGTLESGAFFMLNSRTWLKNIVGPRFEGLIKDKDLQAQIRAIQRKYPESQGYSIFVTRKDVDRSKGFNIDDFGTLDKLLSLMEADSGKIVKKYFDDTMGGLAGGGAMSGLTIDQAKYFAQGFMDKLPANIKSIMIDNIAAGFMKQSRDIAGYDTNFINRLFDYNRIVATTVSHRMYRKEYSLAMDEAMNAVDKPEQRYIKAWDNYVDTPEHAVWKGARAIGFFNAMWGSIASGSINAFSAWTVVAPQMTVMKASAGLDVYKQSVIVMAAMRGRPDTGLFIDPKKIAGLSSSEREALQLAFQRGIVRAQLNPELMGMEAGLMAQPGKALGKTLRQYFNIGASVISVTEEIPKVAAFITAYRYAQDPRALANWKKEYENNLRAKAIMEKGASPFDVAEFMVETTTFIGGQIEKPPIMRQSGGAILQFSQYPLQFAHLLYQNFAKMGPRGRIAGMFTVLSIWSTAGLLYGIPFGDDAINIFEWIMEKVTGKKGDFRLETQKMIADILGGGDEAELNAEALMYGPMRALLNIDVGKRVGFTSMMPELGDPISAIPALSTTLGKWNEAMERYRNDQPIGATISLLSPFMGKGASDIAKAFIQYPTEGYRTRYGSIVKADEDITAGDMFTRSLGYQSADIARRAEARRAEKNIAEGTRTAERSLTIRLSKLMAEAIKAEDAGKMADAERFRTTFDKEYQVAIDRYSKAVDDSYAKKDPNIMASAVKPPSSQTLRESTLIELHPELTLNNRGKVKREAILEARDTIMAGETEGDLFLDQEDEGLSEEE